MASLYIVLLQPESFSLFFSYLNLVISVRFKYKGPFLHEKAVPWTTLVVVVKLCCLANGLMPPQKTFNLLQVFKKSFSLFTDVIDKGHPTTKYVRSVLAALKTIYFFWCLQLDRGTLIVCVPFPWPFVFLYQTLRGFISQVFYVRVLFTLLLLLKVSSSPSSWSLSSLYDHISLIIAPTFGVFLLRIDLIVMTILTVTLCSWQSFIRLDKEEVFSNAQQLKRIQKQRFP